MDLNMKWAVFLQFHYNSHYPSLHHLSTRIHLSSTPPPVIHYTPVTSSPPAIHHYYQLSSIPLVFSLTPSQHHLPLSPSRPLTHFRRLSLYFFLEILNSTRLTSVHLGPTFPCPSFLPPSLRPAFLPQRVCSQHAPSPSFPSLFLSSPIPPLPTSLLLFSFLSSYLFHSFLSFSISSFPSSTSLPSFPLPLPHPLTLSPPDLLPFGVSSASLPVTIIRLPRPAPP